jgi:hypothetical protein
VPWVRLDDRFPTHRKVALLSDRAFRLYVSALCWSSENLTEGHITERELPLVARIRGPKAIARELETAGLWDRDDDGWTVHDYLEYNPSRARVKEDREANAARQQAYRERKRADRNGDSNGVTRPDEDQRNDATATRTRHDGDTNASGNESLFHEEQQVSEFRNAVSNAAPSPTRPLTTSYGSSSDVEAPQRDDVERICTHLADRIEANGSKRPTITKAWRNAARLMLDKDGRTEQQVHAAIDWCQDSEFWRSNVLSIPKLRDKYDTLRLQATRPAPGGNVVPIGAARPSTTDQRVAEGMNLAARLRAQEAAQ